MNYHIRTEAAEPAYLQLYQLLRRDIIAGVYPYGTRLPSKRTVAAETGISLITVEHALALLTDEGYVEARQRSGFYVIYHEEDFQGIPAPARTEMAAAASVTHGGGAFPFAVLAKTMRRVLADYGERILVKSPNHGCSELRNAVSAYLARSRGISVMPKQIIIGSGAEYLYGLIAQLFGSECIFALEDPSYDKIQKVYRRSGITCDLLRLGADGICSVCLQETKATVLHVTPFNSYPSGITVGATKKQEYLRWAKQRGGCIIEDNYDSELTVSKKLEDTLFSMSGGSGVIYINTFSQTIAPSIRIGYLILPEELLEVFDRRLGFYSCTVPVFEQYVLAELLQSGDFERHINRVRRRKRRELEKI